CAIEFRHLVERRTWRAFWDTIFMLSSALLALCFGAALGNGVRGVPLDANDSFFEPLWTHFGGRGRRGILAVLTVLVGVAASRSPSRIRPGRCGSSRANCGPARGIPDSGAGDQRPAHASASRSTIHALVGASLTATRIARGPSPEPMPAASRTKSPRARTRS